MAKNTKDKKIDQNVALLEDRLRQCEVELRVIRIQLRRRDAQVRLSQRALHRRNRDLEKMRDLCAQLESDRNVIAINSAHFRTLLQKVHDVMSRHSRENDLLHGLVRDIAVLATEGAERMNALCSDDDPRCELADLLKEVSTVIHFKKGE